MNDPFERAVAREELQRRERRTRKVWRSFAHHLRAYVAVNLVLVAIWALTDREGVDGGDEFWPIWVILGWGIGLYFHWSHYRSHLARDRELREQMERGEPVGDDGESNL